MRRVPIRLPHMLTDKPNIVIALPPKRAAWRKKAAGLHANLPLIVGAKRKPRPLDDVDHDKPGQAADRLWQEIKRAVAD